MGEIHEVIASTVGEANPNWAIKESSWKALKSLPGGKDQSDAVLFFRGDLAHAGEKYDGLNIRLHCYVQIAGVDQEQNATEAVVFQTFRCDKCLKPAYTRKKLAAHRRTCSERGLLKCPYQGSTLAYDVRNSFNSTLDVSTRSMGTSLL
ncbi:hypothetical protein L915_00535 [Phytophthora nicotianae]|uniref:Uncharacterized protein n=1 Tax=Phytophthora nicotianae TaxID=4792 RepID=W2HNU4_PHYNI|nr:hypothetical protein L915_00535 [Phytophthora nicotianae]